MGISAKNNSRLASIIGSALLTVACAQQPQQAAAPTETEVRMKVAAANMQDAVVVDCQLPGSLRKLGGTRTYLTPGKLMRLPAVDCRSVGGDYEVANLSSGTLSLARWQPLAEKGDPEAQYYVARIYANGMSGVQSDYAQAASWYKRASEQRYKPATLELAYLYEQGLGVREDRMLALNMQREASGLGEDLDYSSKIASAQADAAGQVAAISRQLEESNAALQGLRGQLFDIQGSLARSRSELTRSEDAVLELRAQLTSARNNPSVSAANSARVKQLESTLADKEKSLASSQARIATLENDLKSGQAQLTSDLASSQASSAELTRLLASSQAEAKSLRSRAAQTEQRLISSQEELRQLRASYREEVDRIAAQSDELAKLRRSADGGAGLLVAKQKELDRQALRVKALEKELAAAKQGTTVAAASATESQAAQAKATAAEAKAATANAQNASLRESVTALQARYDEQSRLLQSQRAELASLQSKGQVDRTALVQSLSDKLQRSSLQLQDKQRRLASLESETAVLRTQYKVLQDQADKDKDAHAEQLQGMRSAMNMVQQERNERASELERLRTEAAKERSELVVQRQQLQDALSGQQKNEREIARLRMLAEERENIIKLRDKMIASLEQQLDEPMPTATLASNIPMRSAAQPVRKVDPEAAKLLTIAQTSERDSGRRYHALVIGNSNYAFMAPLATPLHDARDVADVLRTNYGFQVEMLLDATADKIMVKLDEISRRLTDSDNLLIYYAGHGDRGPSGSAYWLGTDANKIRSNGWLPLDNVRDVIKRMKARHVMVVADACFAGAITHAKTMSVAREVSEKRFQIQWNRRARMVLTSGQNTPVPDSDGSRDHSMFATYFIQVLRQNMILMSGEMLSYELAGRLVPEARKVGIEQQPTYSTLGDANHDFGEFFFVPVPTKLAALTTG